jgi:hypothetical protein
MKKFSQKKFHEDLKNEMKKFSQKKFHEYHHGYHMVAYGGT